MFEITPFSKSKLTDKQWDEFVGQSDNGTMFHTRKFLSYHPNKRFKDASFVILKKGTLYSVFSAVIMERNGKKILSSHSGASYGGFIHKSNLNLKESFSIVEALVD